MDLSTVLLIGQYSSLYTDLVYGSCPALSSSSTSVLSRDVGEIPKWYCKVYKNKNAAQKRQIFGSSQQFVVCAAV